MSKDMEIQDILTAKEFDTLDDFYDFYLSIHLHKTDKIKEVFKRCDDLNINIDARIENNEINKERIIKLRKEIERRIGGNNVRIPKKSKRS